MPKAKVGNGALAVTNIPSSTFTEQKWWEKLNADEQATVLDESQKLAGAMVNFGNAYLSIGEHLVTVQAILEPHNVFQRYLKIYHFSKKTAYRYIAGFKNAKSALPEPILKQAMLRGMKIIGESEMKPLGVYTKAVEKLPPPEHATEEQAITYLTQLEDVRKQAKSEEGSEAQAVGVPVVADPQQALLECYKFCSLRIKRLPANVKTRQGFIQRLVGMLLKELDVKQPQTFTPQAIPAEFQVQRGRPKGPATIAA